MNARWFSALRVCVIAGLAFGPAAPAASSAPETPQSKADACLDKAAEQTSQAQFSEAADNYVCAADEMAKIPGQESRSARYRANAHMYRSWGSYTQAGFTGSFGKANLDEALRQIELSLPLWREANFPVGEQLANAWQLYLTGVKTGLSGRYAESRDMFAKARAMFIAVGDQVPQVREMTQNLMRRAEDQTIFAEMMDLMSNRREYEKRGGEINQRLADLKQRAAPATRAFYDDLAAFFGRCDCSKKRGRDWKAGITRTPNPSWPTPARRWRRQPRKRQVYRMRL
jgi:hypothetical protein